MENPNRPDEDDVISFGNDLFNVLKKSSHNLFDPNNLTEKFLSWGMKDEQLKVALFRFVDVLANLSDASSVIKHVQEYFEPLRGKVPDLLLMGLSISPDSITSKVISRAIQQQIRYVAKRFIVGDNATSALETLKKLNQKGIAFTVDLVGESAVSEYEAEIYKNNYLDLINTLSDKCSTWAVADHIKKHRNGPNLNNVSVKLSALYSQAKPVSTDYSVNKIVEKLHPILVAAKAKNAFVYLDMEDCSLTEITLEVFKKALCLPEFKDYPKLGIVLQAYLKRTESDLLDLIVWLKKRETPIGIRLVKGAYWDSETIMANQQGWDVPVWQVKSSSDANYEKLSSILLDHNQLIVPAFASHNVRSLAYAIKCAELRKISPSNFEIQTLYGMAEPIKHELISRGYLVRDYCPIGDLIPAMGYLVRRLLENTANEGFLKQSSYDSIDPKELLKTPQFAEVKAKAKQGFQNLPLLDFTEKHNRENLAKAIAQFKNRNKAIEVVPVISGKLESYSNALTSSSPESPNLKLASIGLASTSLAEKAIKELQSYHPTWKAVSIEDRCEILKKTAQVLIKKRLEIISAIIFEAGKSWIEADADLAEAVDFLNYYQEQALKLMSSHKLGNYPGEVNNLTYEPRGICLVISPWNFPLAIPCGMFCAALVTGNCAILKPAEQTSLVAKILFDSFLEAGLPKQAAAFLPGIGEEVGSYLSQHPAISTIVFTGSKQVGLHLIEKCTPHRSGMEHIRRVITEMGGKNFIIVDDDADLDEAVKGVIYSAFGFQGQKCSACSIVIAVGNCYQRFSARLAEAVKSLKVGPASEPESVVGPVIDSEAHARIKNTIETARKSYKVLAEAPLDQSLAKTGYYISPIVFSDVSEDSELFKQEVFGPVLVLHHTNTFEQAINLANKSEYGLTGGVFSRSPKHIELTTRELKVGNLYINRGCTGALVMRQPFGGAKLSGVGSKAGGHDYLLQFVVPKTISENTMRRGFAPV